MRLARLAAVAAFAALPFTPLPAQGQSSSSGGCSRVLVEPAEDPTGPLKAKDSVSASKVLDIQLTAVLTGGWKADHFVEFRVFTPTGALYQSLSVPFTAEAKDVGRERVVDGYPRPIPAKGISTRESSGGRVPTVATTLPIGGTAVTQNSLYGVWRLEAFVDGASKPCAKATTFRIDP